MSVLSALARAGAAASGRALPTKTRRHVHLSGRPLVLVAAQLAGEACAPLAVLVGDDREKPRLLVVSEPRDRTQRFKFAADLASVVLPAIDARIIDAHIEDGGGPEPAEPCPDAPQLLVPNLPHVAFLRLLGRSTRFRKTEGEYAVQAAVPLLGRWLTYYAERAEVTPSALLLPMTAVLADHWATGQSATEDANLAALLGWIDPPEGMTGDAAARAAEDPVRSPPAGPVTDPTFDNEVLAPLLHTMQEATLVGDGARLAQARAAMDHAVRSQLEPTWGLMWRAVDLLSGLPPGAHVEQRWLSDRWSFTNQAAWIREGGAPQARKDSAVAAARRLARLEREQQRLAVERAYDDPLVMAEYRMSGEAFAGTVTSAEPSRLDTASGKKPLLRPWITVATSDEVLFEPGAVLKSPARSGQQATVVDVVPPGVWPRSPLPATVPATVLLATVPSSRPTQTVAGITDGDGRTRVILELKGGMGRSLIPQPGSVPAVGEQVTYTSLRDDFQPAPKFPDSQDTPWTHGGPPAEYVPDDADAREDWS